MNLDNVTAELRPRGEWEAVDFGVRMIRRDAAAIYRLWFAITLPLVALTIAAIFLTPYPALAVLVYWWLEPVTDGPILRIISRRLFGEPADAGAAIRSMPALAWKNRLFLLTPYRMHLARSIALPVTQLEGLKGAARRSRSKVLNLRIFNYGTGVTVAYQHLFTALYLGIILIAFTFIPANYQDDFGEDWLLRLWLDDEGTANILGLLIIYVAQSALHPWFVGAGFGLYINCRTKLEAWDIEVAFRRMIQRRAGLATAAVIAFLALPLATLPGGARAQDEVAGDPGIRGYWATDEYSQAMETVLAHEDLQTMETVTRWRPKNPDEPVTDTDLGALADFLDTVAYVVSVIVEFGLWILLGIALLLLVATRKRWLQYLDATPRRRRMPRTIRLAGGDLCAEDLPDDIPGTVLDLLRDGRKRAALSLLYRGSVLGAVEQHGVRLPPSATEGECVRAVGRQAERRHAEFFARIVAVWIRCAYGFGDPDDDAIVPLCGEWPSHFGAVQ